MYNSCFSWDLGTIKQNQQAYRVRVTQQSKGSHEKWYLSQNTFFSDDIEKLKKTYKHVDDIDLFAGGFLEKRDTDAILGPVFRCIVRDQFYKLKFGDRYV